MKVYDNYEISPCHRFEEPDSPGKFYFEVCEPDEADVWTLYGHINGEGVEAIGDFSSREHAEETFQRITGIPFGGTREVQDRLRLMHTGPKLLTELQGLSDIWSTTELGSEVMDYLENRIDIIRNIVSQATGREP